MLGWVASELNEGAIFWLLTSQRLQTSTALLKLLKPCTWSGGLVKYRLLGSILEFQIQQFWGPHISV